MSQDIVSALSKGHTYRVGDAVQAARNGEFSAEQRHNVLMWIWFHGDVAALKVLLNHGWTLGEIGDDLGLNGACYHGHCDLADFLLANGANPNHRLPETLETPLHAATSKASRPQYNNVVASLLKAGADPNLPTKAGVETGSFMRDTRTRGETPLHRAAAYGDARMIELLLDAGADKTILDCNGDSPLSWASWHLRPGVILRLLAYGKWDVSEWHVTNLTSDHGKGWGNGMENKFL